nr:G5 domain-containing protein [Corynebacterium lujinxingii]
MPRNLEGLKDAAEANGSLRDTVYDSSLAPKRYTSPETISTNTFDIDDAKNHDPNYDSRQQNITSGVANNAPTEGRQTRTFTNVADSNGDTLTDLVNKYNAEIELDDSNVYEGWDAYFRDPDNGDYTVVVESPAGTDARPGSFAQPIVKVTYSNGTQDIIPLLVIVDPNNTQTTDVVYPPETIRGIIGATMTSPAPTLKRVIGKNQKPVKPASYTVDPATVPAGWTINVAGDGTVTATSPEGAAAGDMARPKITATYPDGTVDERELTFLVGDDASLNSPSYPVKVTKPGEPVSRQIQDAPEGVTFTLDSDEVDGWTYSIDPTGAVTVTPPADAQGGDRKANTVTVTYPDGTTDVVPVDTVVAHSFNYEAEPHYPPETAYPGEQITSPLSVDKPDEVGYAAQKPFVIDPGANFTATGENNEFGNPTYKVSTQNGEWTVSLDDEGNVISEIPETAKDGDTVSVKVQVTYEDGSADETEAVVNVKRSTRPIPFDVEYVYDDTIPAGEYKVVTEGVAGEEYQQRDGTWKRTAEPTNEVVHVGIKPAEATSNVTWTAPIPYSTIISPNPELAPGETKVVQQGAAGERTYTAIFRSVGDESYVVQSTDTKDPVQEKIEYGPRLDEQELVTETTRKIPFETQIIPDDTLAAGTQVVDKQGVVGEETVTSKQKLVDGKPSGDPVVETTIVTQKEDAVIRVGTKTEGSNTVEHTEPVPYETKVEYDPEMPAGTYEVVTPGKAGEKTVKVTQTIVNSEVTDTQREETVTSQPTTEVIKVGTKQATATDKVEWTEPIPFSTVVRPNPDLKPGEVVTVQEGVNGEATYTATFEGTNGQAAVKESKDRTEPTDKIVEYGPTIADQTLTSTTTNPVPFNTTFVADPTLPAGEQVVDKQGENGVDTVTATQEIKDGKPVGKPTITTERTKEPVDAVVRVGTKTEGQTVHSVETVIPFEVEVVYDPTLAPGEQKVTQEGVPGTKKVTVTQPVVNSQPSGEATTTEETVKEPTKKIIAVGTKPAEASNQVTWTVDTPYNTVVRPNPELKPGEVKTVQEGEYGEKKYTADFKSVGADSTVTPTEEQTKAPKDQIIEYGPTIDDQTLTSTTTNPVPFNTTFVADPTLAAGEQVVDKQGENGVDTITSVQEIKDGKPVGEPKVTTERTKEPVDAVVRVGTKTDSTNAFEYTEPVPYETKIEYDPTLAAGEYKVVTPGKAGEKTVKVTQTIVNSEVTDTQREENVSTQPTTEVIKVGTKQATATDKVEWTEPIPFSTVVRPNPDLKPGEVVTVQEGVNGEATYTATFEGTNGQATVTESKDRTEPTQQIIEYGPSIDDQTLTTTTTNPVPFNTTFVADPNLPVGQQKVEKQGENGVDTITSVQEIKDGKPVGEPKVTTERTKEPVDAVVRVGTKTEGQTVNSVETVIPFEVEVVYDPTLAPGEQKVTQEGVPGTKKVTVTQPVVNSQPDGEATTTEEIVKEPTKKIIAVGTKPAEASSQVTWTVDTPYNTVVRPNTELKPGEVKTVQEGEYGEKKYTADFKSVGADSTVTPTEEQTKAPKDQIIEYGPTIDDQTLTSTTTNPVPFNTTFVADPTLAAGEQVVDKQGENGVDTITSVQEIKDGKPVGEPKVTTERTKEPVDAVVRVGTKTDSTNAFEYTEPVPYETKIEYDPTLAAGEYKVVTPGKAGEKTVKVTQTIVNSEVTDTQREENVSTQPTTEVIKVGTKQATATDKVEWKEPIPFSTVVRPNPDLKPGEVVTVQEGVNGEATYTATFEGTNGQATVTESKDRTEPTDKIVEYGPGADDANLISVVNRPVPFETTVILDETLPVGEQVVEKQGVLGEEKVTTTRELIDGKLTEPKVTTERTKEPVNAVIRVGTKVEAPKSTSTDVEVPQKTEVIFDTSLEPGQEEVVSEGEPGLLRVTTVNGATSMETVREAKPRIIRVGAKEGEKPTWNEMIPFGVITRENPKLPAGTHKRVVEGKAGLARHVGDEVEILRPATDEVIEVGTGIVNGELRDTTVTPVEFEVEFLEDDSLPVGAYVVQQQGVFGETRTTKSWTFENGQKQGEPRESTEQTKTPQNMIVRVGTKVSSPAPSYDPRLVNVGNSVTAEINSGHNESNAYELGGEVPEGWTVEVDPETGAVTATPPATAKSGETVQIPVRVTTPTGESYVVNAVVGVLEGAKTEDPGTDPEPDQPAPKPDGGTADDAAGSSDKANRCVTNAFAKNSPILWLLPVGILAGIGYGVNEAFGPQIQQASAELNRRFHESMPDLGFGHGRNNPQPEWARELQMRADAVNRQFATYGEQLRPLGIALGAVAAISLTGVLIAQACQEEGFDNGMTVLGSTERVTSSGETGSSSSKGSSENAGSSSK